MTAQTTRERQEALRARRAMLGQTEVRGIYLPPELHADLKALARQWAERLERARAKDQAASEPSEG
jgi:hypothetical protein